MKNLSKRIATITATLALVVVLGITLAACGSSTLSMGDYVQRLGNAGYTEFNITASPDLIERNFEYMMEGEEGEVNPFVVLFAGVKAEDIEWMVSAEKYGEEENYSIQLIKMTSEKTAKAVEANLAALMADETTASFIKQTFGEAVRDGKVLMAGDKASIEIAQGK